VTGKVAVVLFNLGGPDAPDAVRPFLFNLFHDPAIIGVPQPFRWLLATLISRRRAPVAGAIYAKLGGRSPLLPETERQAAALQARLRAQALDATVFVCMRYWRPMSDAVARAVRAFAPDRVVLLPLYPQFSTTTTASSVSDWRRAATAAGLAAPTRPICCYPLMPGLATAIADLLAAGLAKSDARRPVRVLFSAHGLPKKVVARGDPYQWQVEATVRAVVAALDRPDLDHVVCYQSRVGPLEWIGPSVEAELERAAKDGVQVVVVPVAFVSEHSETLVELDIEYRERAHQLGVDGYVRVPTVGCHPAFIDGLAGLVHEALTDTPVAEPAGPAPAAGGRICADNLARCPCRPSMTWPASPI
jgi:ferrochelatase